MGKLDPLCSLGVAFAVVPFAEFTLDMVCDDKDKGEFRPQKYGVGNVGNPSEGLRPGPHHFRASPLSPPQSQCPDIATAPGLWECAEKGHVYEYQSARVEWPDHLSSILSVM